MAAIQIAKLIIIFGSYCAINLVARTDAVSTKRKRWSSVADDDSSSWGQTDTFYDERAYQFANHSTRRLQSSLYSNYITSVRPVENYLDAVNVTIQLILFNLISLDEQSQTLSTNCELMLMWEDVFLAWDPSDYGGVIWTRLDPRRVWIPDVVLYNSVSTDYEAGQMQTYLIVNYNGTVKLLINGVYQSVCSSLDVQYFPFDDQICGLTFSPWTMDMKAVRLVPMNPRFGNLSAYTPIGEFGMVSLTASAYEKNDPCCPDTTFSVVTYSMRIHRRPTFFLVNYVLPSVLINTIGTMVFLVPCESGEKVTLGISAMLSMMVFLMNMTSSMPPSINTPLLSIYYCACVILLTVEVILSVVVLKMFHSAQYGVKASDWLIATADLFARLSFTKLGDPNGRFREHKMEFSNMFKPFWKKEKILSAGGKRAADGTSRRQSANNREIRKPGESTQQIPDDQVDEFAKRFGLSTFSRQAVSKHSNSSSLTSSGASSGCGFRQNELMKSILAVEEKIQTNTKQMLRKMDKGMEMMEAHQEIHANNYHRRDLSIEYVEIARVFDRFFLITSVLATVIASIAILSSSPYSRGDEGI